MVLVPADAFVYDRIFEAVLVVMRRAAPVFTSTKITSSMRCSSRPLKTRKSAFR